MLALAPALPAFADDATGTSAEAEALAQQAAAFLKANGAEKTFADVTTGKQFKARDLDIVIDDMNGKCLAHGAEPKRAGRDLSAWSVRMASR